jgi:hypothetical protein
MADYGINITWQSYPDYDEWFWDDYWQCTDWMIWYDRLVEHYELSEARLKWKSAWEQQSAGSATWDCLYNETFRQFVEDNELGLESYLADIVTTSQGIVKNTLGTVAWLGKNSTWIIPLGLVLVGGGYIYMQYKKVSGASDIAGSVLKDVGLKELL